MLLYHLTSVASSGITRTVHLLRAIWKVKLITPFTFIIASSHSDFFSCGLNGKKDFPINCAMLQRILFLIWQTDTHCSDHFKTKSIQTYPNIPPLCKTKVKRFILTRSSSPWIWSVIVFALLLELVMKNCGLLLLPFCSGVYIWTDVLSSM